MDRLAIVVSHPIQYYAPWFRYLHQQSHLTLRIFYLWNPRSSGSIDQDFAQKIEWDIDLLSGYDSVTVPNVSSRQGTSHFAGLDNPELLPNLVAWCPDAVLCFGYGWKSLWRLAKKWSACPLILRGDSHILGRSPQSFIREIVRKFLLKIRFKKYSAFAYVGRANRDFYLNHGVEPERLFHVPHAVDNQRFNAVTPEESYQWRIENGITANQFVILFAGKFESKKRPDLLIEAFKHAALPDAVLVLIGSGELESRLRDAARSLDDRVRFCGFLNQSQMPPALTAADLLVLPSQGSGETWGLICNEAMACGTPVIVSDHVGCAQDLIVPGITGWEFEAGNRQQLTDALITAHSTVTADSEKISQATRDHIQNYSYQSATRGLLDMLATLSKQGASFSRHEIAR